MNRSLVASVKVLATRGLAAAGLLVAGCSLAGRSIDTTGIGSADKILVYRSGRPILERSIAADSVENRAVSSWLKAHRDGWSADLNSYAPARLVRGETFSIDFHKDRCILNYQSQKGGEWSQVSRPISGAEPIPEIFAPPK